MSSNSSDDSCLGFLTIVAIGLFLVAVAVFAVISVASIAAIGAAGVGVVYGGGNACKNYFKAFKYNVIDSNRSE